MNKNRKQKKIKTQKENTSKEIWGGGRGDQEPFKTRDIEKKDYSFMLSSLLMYY